jgi:hypothetical protein
LMGSHAARIRECDNPRHHTITDYKTKEVICKECAVVLDIPTQELRAMLADSQESDSMATDHFKESKGRITGGLGQQLGYYTRSSPGDIFRISNPAGLRDSIGKHCNPVVQSNDFVGYQIAKAFARNGDWDSEGVTFVVDYKKDSWYVQSSQVRYDLCELYGIDSITSDRLAIKDLQGYSKLIIDILPELVSRLSINMMPQGRLRRDYRDENRNEILRMLGSLASQLNELLERGDRVADSEDDLGILGPMETEPLAESKKKTVSITEGQERYIELQPD